MIHVLLLFGALPTVIVQRRVPLQPLYYKGRTSMSFANSTTRGPLPFCRAWRGQPLTKPSVSSTACPRRWSIVAASAQSDDAVAPIEDKPPPSIWARARNLLFGGKLDKERIKALGLGALISYGYALCTRLLLWALVIPASMPQAACQRTPAKAPRPAHWGWREFHIMLRNPHRAHIVRESIF